MPRDVQFLELLSDLKAELSLSSNVAVGVDHLPVLRRALRRSYNQLHRVWRWPHLHSKFAPLVLAAGQRFYDLPEELDYDRVTEVVRVESGCYVPLLRGIGLTDYSAYGPGDRADPVLKWDVVQVEGAPQIEVWPVPVSSGAAIQFSGFSRAKDLVRDEDTVDLDSDLVIAFAAASLLPAKEGEKSAKLREAQALLAQLKADSASPSTPVRYGMGGAPSRPWRPSISVAAPSGPAAPIVNVQFPEQVVVTPNTVNVILDGGEV